MRATKHRLTARRVAPLLAVLVAAACYEYRYVPLAEATPGREVRLHLSASGAANLESEVGNAVPDISRIVEGSLVNASDERLLVAVRVASDASAVGELQQRVAIPVEDIAQVELKQLNRRRVLLASVGAGALLLAVVVHYVSGQFGGTTHPFPDPGQSESVVPAARRVVP